MSGIVFGCIVPHPPIIVPDIGRGRESEISSTIDAMEKVALALSQAKPDLIYVISPHGTAHYQAMGVVTTKTLKGDLRSWGADNLHFRFDNDAEAVDALQTEAKAEKVPLVPIGERGYNLDHGVLVPFYFLRKKVNNIPIVPLTFCWLPLSTHYQFGKAIAQTALNMGKRAAIVASGDLSHRLIPTAPAGYDEMGTVFDKKIVDAVADMNADAVLNMDSDLVERAGECGMRSITILMGALEGLDVESEVLSYEGPFGVGYMVAALSVKNGSKKEDLKAEKLHPVIDLAKSAVESYVRQGDVSTPEYDVEELKQKAGVFVSIKKKGELRGCIGTYEPTRENVAEEIISSAIGAASRDPRFNPVSPAELDDLEYSVDILSHPEPVDNLDDMDVKKYGVIVEGHGRKGLLLPDLETVDTVQQQIEIARTKAGLDPDEPIKLYRFSVKRYR